MEELEKNPYNTASHGEDLDFIFNQESDDFDEIVFEQNKDLVREVKIYFRLLKKKINLLLREKMQKNFVNIVYLTLDCPPFTPSFSQESIPIEYILEMQKQYPDNDIRILVPILNLEEDFKPTKKMFLEIDNKMRILEKTQISFDFYLQNKMNEAIVYKFPKNKSNIQVYGLYSPTFSYCKNTTSFTKLKFLAPFLKAARIAIKKMYKVGFSPDIVHCENLPFYLGGEFENKLPYQIKVIQFVRDFMQYDLAKTETFWAAINLADKSAMKKICRDEMIKKCVAKLFNLHNTKRFYKMKDCLKFIYKNYYKFRKYIDKGEDIEENIIFNRLNARITQIFPQMAQEDKLYFNPMLYSLKKADFWVTISKSYYKEILDNPKISGKLYKQIEKNKDKSAYVSYGCNLLKYPKEETRSIYQCFNKENFRDLRHKNKSAILKEFSIDRIKTNFVDPTLFKGEGAKIIGSLDSFYDAPLFFANPTSEIFVNGTDILFNTILKLFELHKNIQIIICIKDGLEYNYIKNWVEYFSQNKYWNGRWVFIDGVLNEAKFLAASDMILLPRRANMCGVEHYLAMNYGCVPIVSRSGILNDTVSDIFDDISEGCGFKTKTSLLVEKDSNELFLVPVLKALSLYQNNPNSWNLLIKNCLSYDASWNFKVLEKYNRIYQNLL